MWSTRLPYAQRYITKFWFNGPEKELSPPSRFAFFPRSTAGGEATFSELDSTVTFKTYKPSYNYELPLETNRHITHVHIMPKWTTNRGYYHEIEARDMVLHCSARFPPTFKKTKLQGWLEIGYEYHHEDCQIVKMFYRDDGSVRINGNIVALMESYDLGDVVGCGYVHNTPSRLFFTKNGRYLGELYDQRAYSVHNALVPMISGYHDSEHEMKARWNYGQLPFAFDIENFFDALLGRSHLLAATLPMEILEIILHFTLLSTSETTTTTHAKQAVILGRLSSVCHRWCMLCSRFIHKIIAISSSREVGYYLAGFRAKESSLRFLGLITEEQESDTWLHRFLLSPLLSQATAATTLWSRARSDGPLPFLKRMPTSISQRIPSLLRHSFLELRTLTLSNYSFPKWTQFAQTILAFPSLDTLKCHDVAWDTDLPTSPPTWLTFSRRLCDLSVISLETRVQIEGFLWLFLCGRLRGPTRNVGSDDLIVSSVVMQFVTKVVAASMNFRAILCHKIELKWIRIDRCVLSYQWKQWERRLMNFPRRLRFEFERSGQTYQLMGVEWPLRLEFDHIEDVPWEEFEVLRMTLPNAHTCRYRLDFEPWRINKSASEKDMKLVNKWRRAVAKRMMRLYIGGLLECRWNGEDLGDTDDTEGVQWLRPDTSSEASIRVDETYEAGGTGLLTWDTDALESDYASGLATVPWIKLYRSADPGYGSFVKDVAYDVGVLDGRAEFLIPKVEPGTYFLAVGDYVYRTENFQIVL